MKVKEKYWLTDSKSGEMKQKGFVAVGIRNTPSAARKSLRHLINTFCLIQFTKEPISQPKKAALSND